MCAKQPVWTCLPASDDLRRTGTVPRLSGWSQGAPRLSREQGGHPTCPATCSPEQTPSREPRADLPPLYMPLAEALGLLQTNAQPLSLMETQPSVHARTRADPAHRPQPRTAEGGAPDCPEHPEPGIGAPAAGRHTDTHLRRLAPAKGLIPCHWAGGATVHQTQDTSTKSGHLRVTPAWAQPPQAARAEASLENWGRRWRHPSTPLKSPDGKAAPTCEATGQLLGPSVTRHPGTAPASETAVKTNGTTRSAGNGGCRTKETAHSTGQPADKVLHQ